MAYSKQNKHYNYTSVHCRSLDAFKVCSFGETRVFTSPVVSDQHLYLGKTQFFNTDIYDDNHRKHARFIPGFEFLAIAGAQLKVIGILDKDANVDDLVTEQKALATFYFKNIVKQAINPFLHKVEQEKVTYY